MPSALLPNGIGYGLTPDVPEADPTAIAYVTRPVPDQVAGFTLIELWYTAAAAVDTDDLILTFECYTYSPSDDPEQVYGTQIGPTLTVTVPSAAAMETPITRHVKLAWLDQRPQQAGDYLLTYTRDQGSFEEGSEVIQSVALTTIGP